MCRVHDRLDGLEIDALAKVGCLEDLDAEVRLDLADDLDGVVEG